MRRFCFPLVSIIAALAVASEFHRHEVVAAEIVRFYTMGEDDPGATKGELARDTFDTVEFPTDVEPFVTLEGFGLYVDGREGPDSFAIDFDGSVDFFEAPRFDPRDFGSFSALSQAWVNPDPAGTGLRQQLWGLGTDNGGAAISEDGFWELVSGGSAGSIVSPLAVDFDAWTHVAVRRTGNDGFLYINGSLVTTNAGFWNGPGDLVVGAGPGGLDPFDGAIDDFIVSGFGDNSFELIRDVKFFGPDSLSGVPGDVNQDSLVDQEDYLIWSTNLGFDNALGLGDVNTLFLGDVDQNGRVNFFDFDIIRTQAMDAGTPLAVPEPTAAWLLLGGVGLITCRRRRRRSV